jgi:multisubunit Na+/H+ antiporter MnhG subunit
MADGTGLLVLVLLFGLTAPLLLYLLVRAEHENREVMGRAAAERVARRDLSDEDDERVRDYGRNGDRDRR